MSALHTRTDNESLEVRQARAQRITNLLNETFPNPSDAVGYLIGALVQYCEKLGFPDNQIPRAVEAGVKALRAKLGAMRSNLVHVVTEDEYKRQFKG